MSIFNDPEFKRMVRSTNLRKVRSILRCIYCWAFLLGPSLFLEQAAAVLSGGWLLLYLIALVILVILGCVLWINGLITLRSPIHKPLKKFIKFPSEPGLRRICAALTSCHANRRYPNSDYDLLREAHTLAARNPDVIAPETLEFYTLILRSCKVAGI